jgi:hypothetical protein
MKCHFKFIVLGTIVLLCLAGCETLGEYDILGEWDFYSINIADGTSGTTLAIFTGTKETGEVVFPDIPPDSDKTFNPNVYTVQSNHITITRPGLPSADCGDCGLLIDGAFTGTDSASGTWHDYKHPQGYGTWTMTRR